MPAKKSKQPKKAEKKPTGRPTAFKKEFCELAFSFALLGATDGQIADFLGVSEQTLNTWKQKHPTFLEALKSGKGKADSEVAKKLYHRALGYSHPEEKIFCFGGEIIRTATVKHYPPDPVAAIFWLKNRQKTQWRDKQEVEQTGEVTLRVVYGDEAKIPKKADNSKKTVASEAAGSTISGKPIPQHPAKSSRPRGRPRKT